MRIRSILITGPKREAVFEDNAKSWESEPFTLDIEFGDVVLRQGSIEHSYESMRDTQG
jgi:hypothetical protein